MRYDKLPQWLVFFLIVAEGFVSIGIEITAIRQMTPYAGSNIVNTSIIIGVFLLFLSVGYYRGGKVKNNYENRLLENLLNSNLILSFGLSPLFLLMFFPNFSSNIILGIVVFSFIIIAPTIFFLGQTIPIVTNFINYDNNSEINGTLLFLSTVGSFLGSILSSLVLMNYLGVKYTILIYIFVLFITSILLFKHIEKNKRKKGSFIVKSILTFVLSISFYSLSPYIYSNNYSDVFIEKKGEDTKALYINHSYSSEYNKTINGSKFQYIKETQNIIKQLGYQNKEILSLGGGGFTLSIGEGDKNNYTYLEIDKDLPKLVETKFLEKKIEGDVKIEDARFYLLNNDKKWDLILMDVFTNVMSIPYSFITKDFFQLVKKRLKDEGYFVINFTGDEYLRDKYSLKFTQTLNEEFSCIGKQLTNYSPQNGISSRNAIFFTCKKKTDEIYTDDKVNLLEL